MATTQELVRAGMWAETAKALATDAASGLPTLGAGSTKTLVGPSHNNVVVLLDTAAGSTVTLPAATGTGNKYRFRVSTTVTSNNHVIKVANSTDVMRGMVAIQGTTGGVFAPVVGGDTITMNGTTTGGVLGTELVVQDVAAGVFEVSGNIIGSGTVATVFTAAV